MVSPLFFSEMVNNKNGRNIDPNTKDKQQLPDECQGIISSKKDYAEKILSGNNTVSYDFNFQSTVSGLSNLDSKMIKKQLGNSTVKARIYCIRHGMSMQEESGQSFQTNDTELCALGKKKYREITGTLKEMGIYKENTYLLYSEGIHGKVERIIESAAILRDGIGIFPERILNDINGLDTTYKENENEANRKLETALLSSNFTIPLLRALKTVGNINIICVIHKSNIAAIEETLFGQGRLHIALNSRGMSPGDIVAFDLDKLGNAINYQERRGLLRLDDKNYEKIIEICIQEEGLKDIFEAFKKGKVQVWEVQNYVNAYFRRDKKLFKKYISGNNYDLRVFCLANLLKNKEYSILEEYYLSDNCKGLSNEEKELILQNVGNHEIKAIFQKLFVSRKEFWSDNDQILIDRYLKRGFYEVLRSNRIVYEKAIEFQESHSVDEMIQDRISGAIRSRNTYYLEEQKKENPTGGDDLKETMEVFIDFKAVVQSGKKYLLRAHVGQGKSFWLTEFIKYTSQQDKEVIFFEASYFFNKSIRRIGEIFKEIEKRGAILCIDAIDEIIENKEEIKQLIADFQGSCIITARPSEYQDQNAGFITLSLQSMDTEDFLQSRFQGQEEKLQKIQKILEDNHLDREVEGNPLLLAFVVLLTKMDERQMLKYEKLKITSLEKIRNKADLYESVVRFILAEHTKKIKKQTLASEGELSGWMGKLGEYAYNIFTNNPQKDTDTEFDSHLSILFRNSTKDQYEFIHKSFYEFFLARHLAKMDNEEGNQKIYDFRDEKKIGNWNDWRDFRPVVLFYGEILGKMIREEDSLGEKDKEGKNIQKLARFLGEQGLLKNDDIFGENFFMGLEIIYKLSDEEKQVGSIMGISEKYEKIVSEWGIQEIIKKFDLIKRFISNTGYIDNKISRQIIFSFPKTEEMIAELGTFEAIERESKWGKWLYREIKKAGNYKIIANEIESLIIKAKKLIDSGEMEEARHLYKSIVNIRISGVTARVVAGTMDLIHVGEFHRAGQIYRYIAELGTNEAIRSAITGIKNLMDANQFEEVKWIYGTIARIGTLYALEKAKGGAKNLMSTGKIEEANEVFQIIEKNNNSAGGKTENNDSPRNTPKREQIEIVGNIDLKLIKNLEQGAEDFLNKNEFWAAGKKLQEIAKFGSPDCIKIALRGAEKLVTLNGFMYARWIYEVIYGLPVCIPEKFPKS